MSQPSKKYDPFWDAGMPAQRAAYQRVREPEYKASLKDLWLIPFFVLGYFIIYFLIY